MNTIEKLSKTSLKKLELIPLHRNKLEVIYKLVGKNYTIISLQYNTEGCRIYRKTLHEKEKSKSDADKKRMRVRSRQQRVSCFV